MSDARTAIRLTLALTFLSFVSTVAARVVLTLYALALGASPALVGMLGGMFFLFPLLLSWPIGTAADRYGARRLLWTGAVCGVGAMLLPYAMPGIPAFFVAALLGGLSLAFFHVTLQNLIGVLSPPEDRARNFSNFSMAGATTNFVGPLVAGLAIDHLGHAAACLVVAGLGLGSIAALLAGGRTLPAGNPQARGGMLSLASLADRGVVRNLLTSSLVQLGTDLFQFGIPIYGHARGLSALAIGSVLACFATASFSVRVFLPRLVDRVGAETLLAWSFAAGAAGFVLVPAWSHPAALGAVAFLFGLGMGCGTPLTVMLMFSASAQGRSGQTLGLRLTANNLVRVLGPMAFGAATSLLGLAPVFFVNAAAMGCGALLARGRGGKRPLR